MEIIINLSMYYLPSFFPRCSILSDSLKKGESEGGREADIISAPLLRPSKSMKVKAFMLFNTISTKKEEKSITVFFELFKPYNFEFAF